MVDPINHDGASTAATVGSKALKWGALGALAAVVLPAVLTVGALAAGWAAVSLFASGAIAGGLALTGVTMLAGIGVFSSYGFGAAAAAGGAIIGGLKGADQVSRENSSFRARVAERMNGRENKDAKNFNDGEVKGLEEGYALAVKDLKPQLETAYAKGQQDGAQMVVAQIQEHMQQEMAAAASAEQHHDHAKQTHEKHGHDKHLVAKPPIQIGSKVIASCECPDGSKAAAIAEQQVKSQEPGQHAITT